MNFPHTVRTNPTPMRGASISNDAANPGSAPAALWAERFSDFFGFFQLAEPKMAKKALPNRMKAVVKKPEPRPSDSGRLTIWTPRTNRFLTVAARNTNTLLIGWWKMQVNPS